MRKLWKALLWSFGIVIVSALLLRVGYHYASATENVDQSQGNGNGNDTRGTYSVGQSFIPDKGNLSSFTFYATSLNSSGTTTIIWNVCHGTPDKDTWDTLDMFCNGTGQELVQGGSTVVNLQLGVAGYNIPLSEPHTLTIGDTYFFVVWNLASEMSWRYSDTPNPDYYADGKMVKQGLNQPNRDFTFHTYYEDDLGVVEDTEYTIYEDIISKDYQFLSFNREYFCIATTSPDFPCVIDFRNNSYAVDHEVSIYYSDDITDGVPVGDVLATSTVIDNNFDTQYITVPYDTDDNSGKVVPYCAYLHDPDFIEADRLFCNWQISWLSQSNLDYLKQKVNLHIYDITEACADMDETASTTFMYGIECGFKKLAYWATVPSYESQLAVLNAQQQIKDAFPMSIYYQVKDNLLRLSDEVASSSTSTVMTIPLFFYDSGMQVVNLPPFFEEDMIDNALGSVWTNFNAALSYFIYFLTFLYFMKEIFRIAEKGTHDH